MDDLIKKFISGYSKEAKPQSIDETKGDFQLTQMKVLLNNMVRKNNVSTIIDIGCGNGALLYVLDSLNLFTDFPAIKYYGFDLNEQIMVAIQEAINRGVFNKANFKTLQDNWTNSLDKKEPNLIVMRNVFHELSLEQLEHYFYYFSLKLQKKDFLIFQDTTTLLEAEKGRAGWKGTSIENILQASGFQTILTPDVSKKDISVFTIEGFNKKNIEIDIHGIKNILYNERLKQLQELSSAYKYIITDDKIGDIATARISHDILSIKKQLGQKMDEKDYESIYLLLHYALMIIEKDPDFLKTIKESHEYFEVIAFQNRGRPLKMIYSFLSNDEKKILEINGVRLIGKKSLIFHSLKRFKHNRIPVFIECSTGIGITQVFERIIETLNIVKYFDVELISEFDQISMSDFLKNKYVAEFQTIIPQVIVVLLNAESLLSPKKMIENKDILEFIEWWISFKNAKVFIESDRKIKNKFIDNLYVNIILSEFPLSNDMLKDSYGKYRFVIQYFQETVSANYLGLNPNKEDFAETLFECINNHPYLAYLSSKIISQYEDFGCLTDKKVLKCIINKISSDFVDKFELDKDEKGIIYALSLRDGFFEKDVLDCMDEYKNVIKMLIDKGIIYVAGKEFYRLLPVFTRTDLDAENVDKDKFVKYMENVYTKLYNVTGKPKYFRLKYFYSIFFNKKIVSSKISYFLPELSAGAEQFFFEKDFPSAISLYKTIGKKQPLTSKQKLRYGSVLIRGNHVAEGIDIYKELFDEYPKWENAKMSCVGSLLYIEEKLDYCLKLMNDISENHRNTYYYRLLGEIYRIKQETIKVFLNYDLALEKMERFDEGIRVLLRAISYAKELGDDNKQKEYFDFYHQLHLNHIAIDIEYGSFLEKRNHLNQSEIILADIYENNPNNAYAIFAYIKTLCSLCEYKKAKNIIDDAYLNVEINTENRSLINSANVHYLISVNEYSEAINILEKEIIKNRKNIHLYGQWADLFYKYYMYVNEVHLLEKGLKYYSHIMATTNVPAMISCLNIAKIKGDEHLIERLEKRINELNNNISI